MYSFLGCEKAKTLSQKGCEKAKTLSQKRCEKTKTLSQKGCVKAKTFSQKGCEKEKLLKICWSILFINGPLMCQFFLIILHAAYE